MNHPEITSMDADRHPSICLPLGLLKKAAPKDAGKLFDRLFDAAEKRFGDYPDDFRIEKEGRRLLCARPREEESEPLRPKS